MADDQATGTGGLRRRLTLAFLLVGLLPAAVAGVLGVRQSLHAAQAARLESEERLVALSAEGVAATLRDGLRILQVAAEENALRRTVQVVFQDPFSSLSPRMTVEEIVGEGLLTHQPELSREQRQVQVLKSLQEVGLEGADHPNLLLRYPHEFSGGQRQRLAIARVVVLEPKLILLDEPTSALDVSVQKQVLELLRELQRKHGMSYLFITHDLRVIRAMAHRLIVMRAGQVVEAGETEALFAAPKHEYTQALLHASLFDAGTE